MLEHFEKAAKELNIDVMKIMMEAVKPIIQKEDQRITEEDIKFVIDTIVKEAKHDRISIK